MLRIKISCHILFFNPTSEILVYILNKEIPRYKLNRDPKKVKKIEFSKLIYRLTIHVV
jgi:hypothetical protein